METLRPWIGRVRTVEDDIGMMAVRRVAATFDVDPDSIKRGQELPPHWFTVFFAETVRQGELGPDGHPNKGIVLPPIPMPRRMGAGRRVQDHGPPQGRRTGDQEGRGRRHRSQDRPLGRHLRADDAPHDRTGRQDHRRRHVRRDLPPRRAARPEDHGDRGRAGAHGPGLDRDHAAHQHAQLPLRRHHLERPPHPL